MPSRKQLSYTIAGFEVLIIAVVALAVLWPKPAGPRTFTGVEDFRQWAKAEGFHAWPGPPAPACHVSDDPEIHAKLDSDDAAVAKAAYRSIATVCRADAVDELPAGASHEVWGSVVIYGNPQLIQRINANR